MNEKVHEIDFTSLYPPIIVKYNLSPRNHRALDLMGFLSTVLSSLLSSRIETKRLKKTNPDYAGIDSVLGLELPADCSSTAMRFAARPHSCRQ